MHTTEQKRPNILFIMTDDHGTGALSCYGSQINETPNLDRIAKGGMLLKNCFVTTSLCSPSRASILTGTYPHMNGQVDIGGNFFDGTQPTFPRILHDAGYQTAVVGKWHLHSIPVGFDHYSILSGHGGQGSYQDPEFVTKTAIGPVRMEEKGYSTDIITDKAINWMKECDPDRPFVMLCHYKSPHYNWEPDAKHMDMYTRGEITKPPTFEHEYTGKAGERMTARVEKVHEFFKIDRWGKMPEGLTRLQQMEHNYQLFIKDYLRCIASVDDNVGRILDYLDEAGLAGNTIVVYTSDNGMLQADHGLVDKQLMQEESIHVPFIIRYPQEIPAGSVSDAIVINCDYAPSFLDYCGAKIPGIMQGRSARELFKGNTPSDWRKSFYYHFYAHYKRTNSIWGVRTENRKLVHYYRDNEEPARQLFDLDKDPLEVTDLIDDPAYQQQKNDLEKLTSELQAECGLTPQLLEQIYAKKGAHNHIPPKPAKEKLDKEIDENTEKWQAR